MSSFTPELFLKLPPVGRLLRAIMGGATYLRKDARIVFVCGATSTADRVSNREVLLKYLDRHLKTFRFFRAEDVFDTLEMSPDSDLLSVEDDLGKFSDCIIVVCESESAFAELGAFALSNDLAKQLLVINDQRHAASKSFINLGPIKKADRVSFFKPAIFANFSAILSSAKELKERLDRIPHKRRQAIKISKTSFDKIDKKIRLLMLADLINLFSPISRKEILYLIKHITKSESVGVSTELSLGVGLGLFSKFKDSYGQQFFFHSLREPVHLFDYDTINRAALRSEIYRVYRQHHRERLSNLQLHVFIDGYPN